jgi:phytol kinase
MLIEFIKGFGLLVAYYLVFIAIAVVMRKFIDIPSEIFRKMLHLIVLASVFIFTYGFQTWWISCEGTTVKYLYIPIIKDGKLGPVSKVQLVQYGADVVSNGAFP